MTIDLMTFLFPAPRLLSPVLAQVSAGNLGDDEIAYGLKLVVLGLAIVFLVVSILDKFKKTPPNHEVYATKLELGIVSAKVDSLSGKMEKLNDKIVDRIAAVDKADEERTVRLHEHFDSMFKTFMETLKEE